MIAGRIFRGTRHYRCTSLSPTDPLDCGFWQPPTSIWLLDTEMKDVGIVTRAGRWWRRRLAPRKLRVGMRASAVALLARPNQHPSQRAHLEST